MPSWLSRASAPRSAPSTPTSTVSSSWRGRWPREQVTLAAFPEQVIGGYPPEDLVAVARFPRRPATRARARSPPRQRISPTVFVLGLAVAVGGQHLQLRRGGPSRRVLGLVPKEKLPTYNVFYEGRTFSRGGRGLALDADGVPLGDFVFGFDFGTWPLRCARTRGRPTARCAAAATPARRSSSTSRPRPIGWASTRPGARCWRRARPTTSRVLLYANAVGGQDGLIFDGGGFVFQNGRLCSRRRASARAGGPRWSTSTARAACASRTPPGAPTARVPAGQRPRAGHHQRPARPATDRQLAYPAPEAAASSCRRRRRAGRVMPARSRARRSVRGAGARRQELLREDRRLPFARHRALRRPRLDADAARRVARRAADDGGDAGAHRRLLHAQPPLAGRRHASAARLLGRGARRRRCRWCRSTRPTDREVEATRACSSGSRADRADAPERAGPPARPAACGTGPTAPARCSCRPAT